MIFRKIRCFWNVTYVSFRFFRVFHVLITFRSITYGTLEFRWCFFGDFFRFWMSFNAFGRIWRRFEASFEVFSDGVCNFYRSNFTIFSWNPRSSMGTLQKCMKNHVFLYLLNNLNAFFRVTNSLLKKTFFRLGNIFFSLQAQRSPNSEGQQPKTQG